MLLFLFLFLFLFLLLLLFLGAYSIRYGMQYSFIEFS